MRAVLLALLVAAGACRAEAPAGLSPALADLPILTRGDWGAAAPVAAMRPHVPDRITIHHTAAPRAPERPTADKLRALQRFSQQRSRLADGSLKDAWADLPYHYYIAADGTLAEGRELGYVGDSNTSYDLAGHIQVVVEGNFERESPTPAQIESLAKLTHALASHWGIPPTAVRGHRDHAATLCPGETLHGWLPELREWLSR